MGRIRQDVAVGLFRSASNLDAFQNMLERLSKRAQASGPGTGSPEPKLAGVKPDLPTNTPALKRVPTPVRMTEAKVGRNDACPCGSGKKYKKCCGKDA